MYPVADNEAERLQALRDFDLVGTPPDERFDAICRTASALFGLPIALVSLVEADQQRFAARCGLDVAGTARDVSFCTYAILSDEVFVVEDATRDDRFSNNPLVTGPPGIRFYAGAPLILGAGIRIGSICVIDTVPHSFSMDQRRQLSDLALVVVSQLRQNRIESDLRRSEAQYRLLAENTSDMIVWCDLDSTRRYVSPASRTLFGFEPHELLGTKPIDFVHPEDIDGYRRTLDDIGQARVDRAVSRQRYRCKDGSWTWVEVTFGLTRTGASREPDGYVASVRDINERKQAEMRIAHMARHDALTELANRTLFQERLAQEVALCKRRGNEFALLCLDLDRFKAVNDTLGHQAGDAVLRTVANRLRAVVRTEDTVARMGGDEFVILQTGPGQPDSGSVLARRLIEAAQEPILLDHHRISIGMSIGIALASRHGTEADELYRNADLALYRAKAEGRNTYRFYDPCMTKSAA